MISLFYLWESAGWKPKPLERLYSVKLREEVEEEIVYERDSPLSHTLTLSSTGYAAITSAVNYKLPMWSFSVICFSLFILHATPVHTHSCTCVPARTYAQRQQFGEDMFGLFV